MEPKTHEKEQKTPAASLNLDAATLKLGELEQDAPAAKENARAKYIFALAADCEL